MPFNHLTPKDDKHLISPKSITPESNFRAERIEEMITVSRNSPDVYLRKCIESSLENIHSDVRVKGLIHDEV